jgi:TolB-like protein/Tfp pilus assembly protein PilF
MSLGVGSRLGPYEIRSLLSEGGMGQVWRAHDTRLERDVALKVLPTEILGDETARARLVREARLASKLNHPHICTIYEVGESGGQTFVAMELVEGQSLSARLSDGPLRVEQVLQYGQQMAEALAHAHGHGVAHRDFKSASVVVTPEGQVKVLDFGLAKQLTGDELTEATTVSDRSNADAGMLAYKAPEQLKGQPADARSDIWALGVALHEMATGRRPFRGETGFEVSSAILSQPPAPLPSSVPPALAEVMERCLAKEPGDRYQQATEALAALAAVTSGQVRTTWRGMLRRRRGLLLGAASGALALLVSAAVLFGLDVGGVRTRLSGGTSVPARIIRLAVLPFANASGEAEQEYFSDGLTQELITQLGRLHPAGLEVIARTSVMRYKKGETPIDQIGRDLRLDYILQGSAGLEAAAPGAVGRVRIAAKLIKVADHAQLWAEQYERELAGILVLQSDVARNVARALALKLLPAEQARLASARAVIPEAYDACKKGDYYRNALVRESLETAENYYNLALQKDPSYAAAWAGIARVWNTRGQLGMAPVSEATAKGRTAAYKALDLDDTAVEPHQALAGILTWTDWDWPAAGRAWRRTLELDPGNASAMSSYSHFLMIMGRQDEAMKQIERALELDPFNVQFHGFYAQDLLMARRYDEAVAAARKTLGMQPNMPIALTALITAFWAQGLYEDALAAERATWAGDDELTRVLDEGYAQGGYTGALARLADTLAARIGKPGGVQTYHLANLYLHAGDRDRAFEWLEKAYAERNRNMPYIALHFESVRSDPRYQGLVRRMGLPQ